MRKYFEVIDTVKWLDDDYESETLVLTPGQIVEIELDDTPNGYPCLVLDNDMLDIAFDTWEEFYEFFKEFDDKSREVIESISDNKTLVMKLNTGECIIILLDKYDVNKKSASSENIELWRVTKDTPIEFMMKIFEEFSNGTWPDELEYIECKRAYSNIVDLELDVYLLLNDEEAWNELKN